VVVAVVVVAEEVVVAVSVIPPVADLEVAVVVVDSVHRLAAGSVPAMTLVALVVPPVVVSVHHRPAPTLVSELPVVLLVALIRRNRLKMVLVPRQCQHVRVFHLN